MYSIIQTAKDFGVDVEWAVSKRKEYLNNQISKLRKDADEVVLLFSGHGDVDRFLLLDSLKLINTKITKLENELKYSGKEPKGKITAADIERAKQYPLENLLQNIRNNKTNCISGTHADKHPSMDVRNCFVYCYSCGFHGDVIKVYMTLNNVNFVTAVKALKG